MRVITVGNGKGGVGKTTVAVHLAEGFRRGGSRVLLIDTDAQCHASEWMLGVGAVPEEGGVLAALGRERIEEGDIVAVDVRKGLSVLPASPRLGTLEPTLQGAIGGHLTLRNALAGLGDQFDVVVIDTAPSHSGLTTNALVASGAVLSPITASGLSLLGLSEFHARVEKVRDRLGVPVRHLGNVLFSTDARIGITADTREHIRGNADEYGPLLESEVRVSAAAKTLPLARSTSLDAGKDARGLEDYTSLVEEVRTLVSGKAATA